MKKQEYLVVKRTKEYLTYRTDYFTKYKDAWNALRKYDIMIVCKDGGVYWNSFCWDCHEEDYIRSIERK